MSSEDRINTRSIDGLRAVTHLSLIALHTAMIVTGNLPSSGAMWSTFKNDMRYTTAQAGGVQVDIMFMISAFLLVTSLLNEDKTHSIGSAFSFLFKRIVRLLPPIIAVAGISLYMGDSWRIDADPFSSEPGPGVPVWKRFLTQFLFIQNYLPSQKYGSFTLTLCWSCCVDVQVGFIIYLIYTFIESICGKQNKSTIAKVGAFVFFVLIIVSTAIRWSLFSKDKLNIFLLGQNSHFGLLQSDDSYRWIQENYNHTWRTSNAAAHLSHAYVNGMYQLSHTRFGPFAIGAFTACNAFLAQRAWKAPSNAIVRGLITLVAIVLTMAALGQLIVPCIPSSDDVPEIGQQIATACLRNFSAIAVAYILFRMVLSRNTPWASTMLSNLFSLSIFKPIADLSYCSYLVHFRVIMELNFRSNLRLMIAPELSQLTPEWEASHPTEASGIWIGYMLKLFAVSTVVSLVIAFIMRSLIELPAIALFNPHSSKLHKKTHNSKVKGA